MSISSKAAMLSLQQQSMLKLYRHYDIFVLLSILSDVLIIFLVSKVQFIFGLTNKFE